MKKAYKILMTAVALCSTLYSPAQTAEEIIAKSLENMGGNEKIASLVSIKMDFTMDIMGQKAPAKSIVLVGKGLRVDMDLAGQQVVQVVTDKGGWSLNPFAGITSPQPMSQQQFLESKDQLDFIPFFNYAAKGHKIELAGKEKLDTAEVYKINFTTADNILTTHYFDAATYNLVKSVKLNSMGQQISTTFSDFRKNDYGLVIPFVSVIDFGQFTMAMSVEKVEYNVPVDAGIFEMK